MTFSARRRQRGPGRAGQQPTRVTAGDASAAASGQSRSGGASTHDQRHAGDPARRRRRRRPRPPASAWRRRASGPPVRSTQLGRPSLERARRRRPAASHVRPPMRAGRSPQAHAPEVDEPGGDERRARRAGRRARARARPCRSTRCGTPAVVGRPRRRASPRPDSSTAGTPCAPRQVRAPRPSVARRRRPSRTGDAHVDGGVEAGRVREPHLLDTGPRAPTASRTPAASRAPSTRLRLQQRDACRPAPRGRTPRSRNRRGGVRVGAARRRRSALAQPGRRRRLARPSAAPSWLRNGGLPTTTSSGGHAQVVGQRVGDGEVPGRWAVRPPTARAPPRWSPTASGSMSAPHSRSHDRRRDPRRRPPAGAPRRAAGRRRRTPGRRPSGSSCAGRAPARPSSAASAVRREVGALPAPAAGAEGRPRAAGRAPRARRRGAAPRPAAGEPPQGQVVREVDARGRAPARPPAGPPTAARPSTTVPTVRGRGG